jgi:hypothetical protein
MCVDCVFFRKLMHPAGTTCGHCRLKLPSFAEHVLPYTDRDELYGLTGETGGIGCKCFAANITDAFRNIAVWLGVENRQETYTTYSKYRELRDEINRTGEKIDNGTASPVDAIRWLECTTSGNEIENKAHRIIRAFVDLMFSRDYGNAKSIVDYGEPVLFTIDETPMLIAYFPFGIIDEVGEYLGEVSRKIPNKVLAQRQVYGHEIPFFSMQCRNNQEALDEAGRNDLITLCSFLTVHARVELHENIMATPKE